MAQPRVVIHVEPSIAWQAAFLPKVVEGLRTIGVSHRVTTSRERTSGGLPVLLGTTFWKAIEADGPYMLVDRCSFGDPTAWVSLVLNGHGRRGDHRTPVVRDGSRWERHAVEIQPWRTGGTNTVLCGQTATYSPRYATPAAWYADVASSCTHFRPHPAASPAEIHGPQLARLASTRSWDECRLAVTLNSSVAVDVVIAGIPAVTMDEAAMAWDVTSHDPRHRVMPERTEWLHWLAWTQWTHDEVREGVPWPRFL